MKSFKIVKEKYEPKPLKDLSMDIVVSNIKNIKMVESIPIPDSVRDELFIKLLYCSENGKPVGKPV